MIENNDLNVKCQNLESLFIKNHIINQIINSDANLIIFLIFIYFFRKLTIIFLDCLIKNKSHVD